jgi:SAM-dependent methyltransferase
MSDTTTLPPSYFDAVYAANADPWQFETSDYERQKYAATLQALPQARYHDAFEIGCSIGVLTQMLADRCDALLAVDVSLAALERARQRLAGVPHVQIEQRVLPQEFPARRFDLIVLSEVGYYWSAADLADAAQRMVQGLQPDGTLLLVHWTPPVPDYPLTGDAVHSHFMALAQAGGPLRHLRGSREATYRLDVFSRSSSEAISPRNSPMA